MSDEITIIDVQATPKTDYVASALEFLRKNATVKPTGHATVAAVSSGEMRKFFVGQGVDAAAVEHFCSVNKAAVRGAAILASEHLVENMKAALASKQKGEEVDPGQCKATVSYSAFGIGVETSVTAAHGTSTPPKQEKPVEYFGRFTASLTQRGVVDQNNNDATRKHIEEFYKKFDAIK